MLAITLALALAGCGATGSDRREAGGSLPERARREAAVMHVELPPSAVPEFADDERGLDDNARLIVTMSRADWRALRRQPPFDTIDEARWSTANAFELGSDAGGWTPSRAHGLVAAQAPVRIGKHKNESLNVGVAPAGKDRVRVYLFWFQI